MSTIIPRLDPLNQFSPSRLHAVTLLLEMPSSNGSSFTTNSGGFRLPADITAIIKDSRRFPENGRIYDRVSEHHQKRQVSALSTSSVSHVTPTERPKKRGNMLTSSEQFSFHSCTSRGTPIFQGSIGIISNESSAHNIIRCIGYVVKIPRDDHDSAVLVLDIPGRGRIPCLSPTSILDSRTINQYRKSSKEKGKDDGRKALFRRSTKIFAVHSAPALRDDNVHGHLLCDGPRNFKGRLLGLMGTYCTCGLCNNNSSSGNSNNDPMMIIAAVAER